jgi:hydroxymethylpyrimidine kinase/phosphomethylpyrimidine kinase
MSALPARILTIAGSDSCGGAGIQADLKTITALGGYGMSAITAITAQNTLGVTGVHAIPVDMVRKQIEAVFEDPGVDIVKTGMLLNREIIAAVAEMLAAVSEVPLILDPVMVATSGARLIDENAQSILVERLLPRATLLTPNLPEAEALSGVRITDEATMRQAGEGIHALGVRAVLIKGGHATTNDATDWLFDGEQWAPFRAPRIETTCGHGTGCTLASAIATKLGQGKNLHDAIAAGKEYLTDALKHAWPDLAKGSGPLNHGWALGSGVGTDPHK